jgi:hypothetical protein
LKIKYSVYQKMAKPKKDNRVKRKRGKKFVYHAANEKEAA